MRALSTYRKEAMKLSIKKIGSDFWFSVIYKGVSIVIGTASSKQEALEVIFSTLKGTLGKAT